MCGPFTLFLARLILTCRNSFEFHAKNHTATQSSFGSPCTYLAGPSGEPIGLDSGFGEPVAKFGPP